jgi:hypothetical protein
MKTTPIPVNVLNHEIMIATPQALIGKKRQKLNSESENRRNSSPGNSLSPWNY